MEIRSEIHPATQLLDITLFVFDSSDNGELKQSSLVLNVLSGHQGFRV